MNIEKQFAALPLISRWLVIGTVVGTAALPFVRAAVGAALDRVLPSFVAALLEAALFGPLHLVLCGGQQLGISFIFHLLMLAQASAGAERDVFHATLPGELPVPRALYFYSPDDAALSPPSVPLPAVSSLRYVWFLLVSAVGLFLLGVADGLLRLAWWCARNPVAALLEPLSVAEAALGMLSPFRHVPASGFPMLLLWIWCRLQPAARKMRIPFLNFDVKARHYPFGLVAIHFLMGQSLLDDVASIVVGHVFVYVGFLRRRRDDGYLLGVLYELPAFVYRWVREQRRAKFDEARREGRLLPPT